MPRRAADPRRLLTRLSAAEAGGDRGALARARWTIKRRLAEAPDHDLRMAFAEHYRAAGAGSQAARWGIVTPGWATEPELGELRHWLLGNAGEYDFVRTRLSLRADEPLPAEVVDLVDPVLRAPRPEPTPQKGWNGVFWLLFVALGALVVAAVGIGSIVAMAIGADPDLFAAAPTLGAIAVTAAVIGSAAFRGVVVLERRLTAGDVEGLRHEPSLDETHPTRLAGRLADAGDPRGGAILLRALVRDCDDRESRQLLVRWARDAGRTDQAGRWAIAMPGESTPRERAAYARMIEASFPPGSRADAMSELSMLYDGRGPDAMDVLRRAGAAATASVSPASVVGRELPLRAWGIGIAVLVVGALVTAVLAVLRNTAAVTAGRWTLALTVAVFGVLTASAAVIARPRAPWYGLLAGVAAGLALVCLGAWLAWTIVTGSWP